MNEKIWARTNQVIKDSDTLYSIPEGTFVRLLPWMKQKEYANVQMEYIADGYIREIFVKEAWVEKLTKEEVKLMDFFFKAW